MSSSYVPFEDEECDGCRTPFLTELADFVSHDGDQLCQWCRAVFWTATILFEQGIEQEDVVIPTLAFAKFAAGEPEYGDLVKTGGAGGRVTPTDLARILLAAGRISAGEMERGYLGWDFVKDVEGVPLIRVLPFTVFAEEHRDTRILKQIRIQVLSKYAEPKNVRERYEQLLADWDVQCDDSASGCVSYNFWGGYLDIRIRPTDELIYKEVALDRELIERHKDYFIRKAYPESYPLEHSDDYLYSSPSFPSPRYIEASYEGLRGPMRRSKPAGIPTGIGHALDLYGKPNKKTAAKIIPAFVAWHLGRDMVSTAARLRVARTLNKHLLGPCDKELLPEDSLRTDDTLWRDAKELGDRFEGLRRAAYEKPIDKPIV
jgi:hypothetical protein